MTTITSKRKYILIGFATALFVAGFLVVQTLMGQSAMANGPEQPHAAPADGTTVADYAYPKNESGLTYGKAVPNAPMPDLFYAVTTDGQEGYSYMADIDATREPIAANPEEASRITEQRVNARAKRFVAMLAIDITQPLEVDNATALAAYYLMDDFISTSAPEEIWAYDDVAAQKVFDCLGIDRAATSLPCDAELRDYFIDLLIGMQTEKIIEIPVYLSDGKTQIGVYHFTLLVDDLT